MNRFIPSIISAILMGISQQPWGFGFLAWFSLVPFLFVIQKENSLKGIILQSFLWGFLYHLIFFFWISDNIGLDSIILRYLIMLLVVFVLTLNIILIYTLYHYLKKYFNYNVLYFLPIIIVAIEYLRSLGFYGSIWNSLAYTQIDYLLISQNIEYTGIYGLTFWLVLINVVIYQMFINFNRVNISILIILFLFPWITGLIIKSNYINGTEKINVKIIQPNVSLYEKRQSLENSLNKMIDLSNQTSNDSIDLILWPESSISNLFVVEGSYNSNLSLNMNQFLENVQFSLVAGSDLRLSDKKYNSSILFQSDSVISIYHKQKLVPNVERTPSIFNKIGLNIGLANFDIGKELSMFSVNKINFTSMICIESVFPKLTRQFVNNGAEFITYIVNDGWYPRNPQLDQHARRCIYRAIENRRSVIRCANTGISMIVNPYGNITNRLEFNKEGVIESYISTSSRKTFYTQYGDLFSIFNVVCMIVILVISFLKRLINR